MGIPRERKCLGTLYERDAVPHLIFPANTGTATLSKYTFKCWWSHGIGSFFKKPANLSSITSLSLDLEVIYSPVSLSSSTLEHCGIRRNMKLFGCQKHIGCNMIQASPSNKEGLVIPRTTALILTRSRTKAEGRGRVQPWGTRAAPQQCYPMISWQHLPSSPHSHPDFSAVLKSKWAHSLAHQSVWKSWLPVRTVESLLGIRPPENGDASAPYPALVSTSSHPGKESSLCHPFCSVPRGRQPGHGDAVTPQVPHAALGSLGCPY